MYISLSMCRSIVSLVWILRTDHCVRLHTPSRGAEARGWARGGWGGGSALVLRALPPVLCWHGKWHARVCVPCCPWVPAHHKFQTTHASPVLPQRTEVRKHTSSRLLLPTRARAWGLPIIPLPRSSAWLGGRVSPPSPFRACPRAWSPSWSAASPCCSCRPRAASPHHVPGATWTWRV